MQQRIAAASGNAFAQFNPTLVKSSAIERARSLISQFNLHTNPTEPVPLDRLLDKFDVRFMEDLPTETWGFTLDVGRKIIIAINDRLDAPLTRYVSMHEVGHVALWHPNQLHARLVDGEAAYDELETAADVVAAYLLIPRLALVTDYILGNTTLEELAARLIVPPELVAIRCILYERTRF